MVSRTIWLGLACVVAGAASFMVFSRVFDGPPPPATLAGVLENVTRLDACIAGADNTSRACAQIATELARDAPRVDFAIVRKSNFDVYINGDRILFVKNGCSADDVTVKSFIWAIYPADPSTLPDANRQAGYIGGGEDFGKKGIMSSGTCVLTGKLPTAQFRKFEAGQYNRPTGRWVWFVS